MSPFMHPLLLCPPSCTHCSCVPLHAPTAPVSPFMHPLLLCPPSCTHCSCVPLHAPTAPVSPFMHPLLLCPPSCTHCSCVPLHAPTAPVSPFMHPLLLCPPSCTHCSCVPFIYSQLYRRYTQPNLVKTNIRGHMSVCMYSMLDCACLVYSLPLCPFRCGSFPRVTSR